MDQERHIIDPDGEVIIVLHNTDTPTAETTKADTNLPPEPLGDAAPRNSVSPMHESDLVSPYSKKGKKKKKKNRHAISRAFSNSPEPAPEPILEPVDECFIFEPEPIAEPVSDPIDEPIEITGPAPEATEDCWPVHEPIEDHILETLEKHAPEFVEAAAPEPIEEPIEKPAEEASGKIFCIQVSAKHLTLASPVFKQNLNGGWKEKGSVEIFAEGWDIDAFLVLLRVIHCQNSQLPQTLSLEMLANVAIIADHYKCKDAIGILKDIWIKGLPEPDTTPLSRNLMQWLWVAFFYELPDQFKQTTSTAMSSSEGCIDSLGFPFPGQLIENMNIHREQAIEKVFILLHKTQNAFLNNDRECDFEYSSLMYGALTKELHKANLLTRPVAPFSGLAYEQLMQKVSSLKSPIWMAVSSGSWASNFGQPICDSSSFAKIFGHLDNKVAGIELQSCCLEY
ncbi:hypothetical protein BJX99DRAFT_261927 [Aspergillus californicus]